MDELAHITPIPVPDEALAPQVFEHPYNATFRTPIPVPDEVMFAPEVYEQLCIDIFHAVHGVEPGRDRLLPLVPGAVPAGAEIVTTITAAVVPAVCTALGAWLHARYGRKVRIKIGDIEAEAQTPEEVEKLITRALEIRQRNQEPKVIP